MIKYYHIMIAGFTQKMGSSGNGIDGVEHLIHTKYAGADTRTWYYPWYCDIEGCAESIFRYSDKGVKIQIGGYSFGGQTAVDLCSKLSDRRLRVDSLCLIDPVCRRSRLPIGWLSALNPFATIRVPTNVRSYSLFYQNKNWPRGHKVVHDSRFTSAKTIRRLRMIHKHIDNDRYVKERLLKDAAELHS